MRVWEGYRTRSGEARIRVWADGSTTECEPGCEPWLWCANGYEWGKFCVGAQQAAGDILYAATGSAAAALALADDFAERVLGRVGFAAWSMDEVSILRWVVYAMCEHAGLTTAFKLPPSSAEDSYGL